ncbi:hypothetical protein [uncultured Meiothermus sp.]|uniref:hypothetical protein n=1 Tax=uncultured Meiothermus sp. TaxID=157471 RepID=UPI00260C1F3A|nr:hypothetical protein [uncultured Meiothermus sp.]
MRRGFVAVLAIWLAACAPTYLGSTPQHPYSLEDFPVFTSPAGAPLYGRQRYEERRWTDIARGPSWSLGFSITLEFGFPPRPPVPFPDPVERCRWATQHEQPAPLVRLVLLEAPPGFGVGLEQASYRLHCGRLEQDSRGFEVLRYTTWLQVLYRFDLPAVPPQGVRVAHTRYASNLGTYRLRWQLWEGDRLLAEEDRRFTLTAGR